MPRPKKLVDVAPAGKSLIQQLQEELQLNQSYLSLILGLLIVLVGGIILFNYLKSNQTLGPAQQTASEEETQKDVEPENLPGKYTVKEGDTLFQIAERYYKDGYKFDNIVQANKLSSANVIEAGQVLEIPKLEVGGLTTVSGSAPEPEASPATAANGVTNGGTGGATNQTIWGEKISGDTYTVSEGDWLSTIAGRAYGDVMAYEKIAQANGLSNPDLILPGQVLKIPQ